MPPGLPNPPGVPQIMPRQPGESQSAYRNRRNLALYGQTTYQRRIAAGRARGLTMAEARGHGVVRGLSESERAEQRYQQRYGMSRWAYYQGQRQAWLTSNGFTPQTTGWSWNQLTRAEPWLRYIWEHSSPNGKITPDMIAEAMDLERTGVLPRGYTYDRLHTKYYDLRQYIEKDNKEPGYNSWYLRDVEGLPDVWWYYHP